jgi:DNA-binding transcriptional MerR regulator
MPLTVSEIARRLARPERQTTLRERIRHWTREGLVHPIGEKNPGTGRHRLYEESVLVDVAILNALAGLGVQVRNLSAVLDRANELIEEHAKQEFKEGAKIYLVISYAPEFDEATVSVEAAQRRAGRKYRRKGLHWMYAEPWAVASLYINITRIYETIEAGTLTARRSR